MVESYTELSTDFTTADTVGPISISFSGDELIVTFANFGTPLQRVVFRNVRSFAWTGWDDASPAASPDRIYQVTGSRFLAAYERFSAEGCPFVHFKLGFNAKARFLDVVATQMIEKESGTSAVPANGSS